MCGKSLVEQTAMNSTTDGKTDGELPVTTLENGFQATVIAGVPNKYLNLRNAMLCPIARAYLVNEYGKLGLEDRAAYIANADLVDLSVVATQLVNDLQSILLQALVWSDLPFAKEGSIAFDNDARTAVLTTLDLNKPLDLLHFAVKGHQRLEQVKAEAKASKNA